MVWIQFGRTIDAKRFVKEYIGEDHDRYYDVTNTWEMTCNIENKNIMFHPKDDVVEDLVPFNLIFTVSVRFPKEQLEEVIERFESIV